jgi:hypothetical protein
MTPDLRHLAIILNEGAKKAEEYHDAALASALAAMTEAAVMLHQDGEGEGATWDVETEFDRLAEAVPVSDADDDGLDGHECPSYTEADVDGLVNSARVGERERVAAYIDRAAERHRRPGGGLSDGLTATAWAQVAEWCRDDSIWTSEEER